MDDKAEKQDFYYGSNDHMGPGCANEVEEGIGYVDNGEGKVGVAVGSGGEGGGEKHHECGDGDGAECCY